MTKKEAKYIAQDGLCQYARNFFYALADRNSGLSREDGSELTDKERKEIEEVANQQLARIHKLFGLEYA